MSWPWLCVSAKHLSQYSSLQTLHTTDALALPQTKQCFSPLLSSSLSWSAPRQLCSLTASSSWACVDRYRQSSLTRRAGSRVVVTTAPRRRGDVRTPSTRVQVEKLEETTLSHGPSRSTRCSRISRRRRHRDTRNRPSSPRASYKSCRAGTRRFLTYLG